MYKKDYIYPAIIIKNANNDYMVKFPDFEHIITFGENIEEAYFMAEDALKLELFTLYEDNKDIPNATSIKDINKEEIESVILVKVNLKEVLVKYDNKAIKKTLTIPAWLNKLAIDNNINFSQVLQLALEEKLVEKQKKL